MTEIDERTGEVRCWAIVRNGTDVESDIKYLSEEQEWSSVDTAMLFATRIDAERGAETLCPPFTEGHAASVIPTTST